MSKSENLPAGYRRIALGDIDSTNTEAFRRADAGEPGRLWLTAERQTIGRGRGERTWTSEPGNLYATLLLQLDVALPTALQLPFVAGIAIHSAITACCEPVLAERLVLKWPNDVLLGEEKVCGILVESRPISLDGAGSKGLAVAMGFGVNVAHHPATTRHPATHLLAHSAALTTDRLFDELAIQLDRVLKIWDRGAGFTRILEAWQARGMAIGSDMSVTDGNSRTYGRYAGLDEDGALLLNVDGKTRRILFGDVMFPAHTRTGSQNHE